VNVFTVGERAHHRNVPAPPDNTPAARLTPTFCLLPLPSPIRGCRTPDLPAFAPRHAVDLTGHTGLRLLRIPFAFAGLPTTLPPPHTLPRSSHHQHLDCRRRLHAHALRTRTPCMDRILPRTYIRVGHTACCRTPAHYRTAFAPVSSCRSATCRFIFGHVMPAPPSSVCAWTPARTRLCRAFTGHACSCLLPPAVGTRTVYRTLDVTDVVGSYLHHDVVPNALPDSDVHHHLILPSGLRCLLYTCHSVPTAGLHYLASRILPTRYA